MELTQKKRIKKGLVQFLTQVRNLYRFEKEH